MGFHQISSGPSRTFSGLYHFVKGTTLSSPLAVATWTPSHTVSALLLYKNILVTLTIFWSSQHLCDLVTVNNAVHICHWNTCWTWCVNRMPHKTTQQYTCTTKIHGEATCHACCSRAPHNNMQYMCYLHSAQDNGCVGEEFDRLMVR